MSAYQTAIRLYCEGLDGVAPGCLGAKCEHADGDPAHACEESFSWGQCDSCGSTLGGDRLPAYGMYFQEGEFTTIEMSICTDCVLWHANGEEPEWWSDGSVTAGDVS